MYLEYSGRQSGKTYRMCQQIVNDWRYKNDDQQILVCLPHRNMKYDILSTISKVLEDLGIDFLAHFEDVKESLLFSYGKDYWSTANSRDIYRTYYDEFESMDEIQYLEDGYYVSSIREDSIHSKYFKKLKAMNGGQCADYTKQIAPHIELSVRTICDCTIQSLMREGCQCGTMD
jgi:hypothetical protein